MSDYSLQPANVGAILQNIVSQGTQNSILQALQANGLLGSNDTQINIQVIPVTEYVTFIDGSQDQVTLLGPNVNTEVASNSPVLVGLTSGTNYVSLANSNAPSALSAASGQSELAKHVAKGQPDTVIGGSGRDTIVGNAGTDSLKAGSGREYVASGGGKDTISGGSGHDTLVGGGQSSIVAGSGHTTIQAGVGSSAFAGTPHDTVQAGSGKDIITLGYGNNTVYAPKNGGSATINAGTGSDTIYGPSANKGAETINSNMGGHTTFNLGSGAVTYNLSSKSADTVFGGQGGYLNLNKATTDIAGAASTSVNGQSAVVYTFAGGGSITAVGSVNITFTNTRHTS